MDTIIMISISIAAGFGLLGLAAGLAVALSGVDFRPTIGDDHAR
jgi:hypothetical protein